MKITLVACSVSLGAVLAAACGGVATIGSNVATRDGGESESETGPTTGAGDDSTAAPDASMTGLPMLGINATCQSARSCTRPQICCASFSIGGGAGAGLDVACANACGLGGFQVCATSAECTTPGDVCSPSPLGLGSYCTPQRDAGIRAVLDSGVARDAGRLDAEAPVDAGDFEDAATSDAAGASEAGAQVDAAGATDAGAIVDAQPLVDAAAADAEALIDTDGSTDDGPADDGN